MEKKNTDDHHDQASSSSVSVSAGGFFSRRPSLKIRIRITPEMRKQLKSWDKPEEEEEAVVVKEIINIVKSEVLKEEVKEINNVKSEVKVKEEEELLVDCSSSSSSSFELKVEATKRKFHESYQQIANAKKQRRIQVVDPWNLPPQTGGRRKGKGRTSSSKLVASGSAKSRILNVIALKKKTNNMNRNVLFNTSRSTTLLKPSYIC